MTKYRLDTNMYPLRYEVTDQVCTCAQGKVRLGLCCINNTLRKKNIFCSRTCTRKTFSVEKAKQLSVKNCEDILTILQWNEHHNIKHFRLSSDLFPHYTDTEVPTYDMPLESLQALHKAGQFANQHNHRITMHPSQHNVVGTPRQRVFDMTVKDLSKHADILDAMDVNEDGVLCVHGGGVYGDKEATMRRWIEQFDDLPSKVKRRLAIENCEKSYSVEDCLYLANECKIPMILDTHHYACYQLFHPDEPQPELEELMPFVLDSWKHRTPLFHISDPACTTSNSMGCCNHHDYVQSIPSCLLEIPWLYDQSIDIEVEAKAKEAAIFCLYDKYKNIFTCSQ